MATSTQWQLARDAAERYERILVPTILGSAARSLVEWADLRDGEVVVDIGCGTGAAARIAAEKVGASGRVVGVDINAGMLDVARSLPSVRGAVIEWFENSAYQLPFTKADFDVALCAQTLQFLEDRRQSVAEMYRVLKSGSRIALSLWCEIRESPYFHVLVEAITKYIGAEIAAGLRAAFGLADLDVVRALLTGAGFQGVQTIVRELDLELPMPQDFVPLHMSATPMAAGFQAAPEYGRQAVIHDVSERLAPYETDQGIRVPFRTHFVMGMK
jgi:SAM-dependent methyltransferase